VKGCACGRVHDAAGWAALELVGTLPGCEADEDGPAFPATEHRNCPCGSTLVIAVGSLAAKKSEPAVAFALA
jgi:hypothetical protein